MNIMFAMNLAKILIPSSRAQQLCCLLRAALPVNGMSTVLIHAAHAETIPNLAELTLHVCLDSRESMIPVAVDLLLFYCQQGLHGLCTHLRVVQG